MKLLSIENIAPNLAFPGFWEQKKLMFLQSILSICHKNIIRKHDLNLIKVHIISSINSIYPAGDKYNFVKKEQEQCNEVIEMLQNHGWICCFFQLEIKTKRPSIIPSTGEAYERLSNLNNIRDNFWLGKLDCIPNVKDVFVIEVLFGSGIFHSNLLAQHLDLELISHTKNHITLPIAKGSSRKVHIPISARATLLLEWLKAHPKKHPQQSSLHNLDIKFGPVQAYFSGLEAVIYAQLQRRQLPVPLPDSDVCNPIVFRYTHKAFIKSNPNLVLPKLIQRAPRPSTCTSNDSISQPRNDSNRNNHTTNLNKILLPELSFIQENVEDYIPWIQESLNTINKVRFQLKQLRTDKRGIYQNGTVNEDAVKHILDKVFETTLDRAKRRALQSASIGQDKIKIEESISNINKSFTGLELAISRIQYHLCEKKNTLDTCLNEISSIFEHGLLLYPAVDLQSWDDEDIELVISDYILERENYELGDSTKFEFLKKFKQVIDYARKAHSLLIHIELPEINYQNNIVLTRRNHVLGPSEFDHIQLDRIKFSNIMTETNPVLILAFYAGMRSGEIAKLSLNDIVIGENELTIYITNGKTPSAKRSITLHLLAPPKAVKIVARYYEARLIHYRAYKRTSQRNKIPHYDKRQVLFLSIDGNCHTNTAIQMIKMSLANLKRQVGRGTDLHLLRHSFASMMFLRWYCCKYPDLIKELVDKRHWCFSKRGLAGLRTFFGEKPDISIPETNITAMIHLIKLMGHKNTDTFFQVYVHSYDTVLEHALRRINEKSDSIELPGKLISELVPSMKSRASQVKLKSRNLKDLVNL
jgi:integrase